MTRRTPHERIETIRGHKSIRLKSGRLLTFWDAITAVERAQTTLGTAFSRAFKLAGEDDYYLETVEYRLDRLEEHAAALRHHLGTLRKDQSVRDRIALLRNTDGRTPEEAAAFAAKADALEATLKGQT